jgi:hypothetical protein
MVGYASAEKSKLNLIQKKQETESIQKQMMENFSANENTAFRANNIT